VAGELQNARQERLAKVAMLQRFGGRAIEFETDADLLNSARMSCLPDMAGAIDRLEDILKEEFGLTDSQAAQLADWRRETITQR
jgi:hypothetical protein